jgi:hypothetical protein
MRYVDVVDIDDVVVVVDVFKLCFWWQSLTFLMFVFVFYSSLTAINYYLLLHTYILTCILR